MELLKAVKITKYFGGLEALKDLDLSVESGEIAGLIGPNGAGKSTFFNVISGVYKPTSGRVFFQGEDITDMKTHTTAEKGLVRTFQATRLFSDLSVNDNIYVACHIPSKTNLIGDILGLPLIKHRDGEAWQNAMDIVKMSGLEVVSQDLARNLPHGYQRVLGMAIALAAKPKLLCLDEPVTGMNGEEIQFMMGLIEKIRQQGISILLIEHTMKVVMGICDRVTVINFGRKIAEGMPDEIQGNEAVIEAYLGRPEDAT
jgi:branched-chain amino acid transport system ATP-binding protein